MISIIDFLKVRSISARTTNDLSFVSISSAELEKEPADKSVSPLYSLFVQLQQHWLLLLLACMLNNIVCKIDAAAQRAHSVAALSLIDLKGTKTMH